MYFTRKVLFGLLVTSTLFISSCKTSMISGGAASDRGLFLQNDGKKEGGPGFFLEYRWLKDKGLHSYGVDVNVHQNGYTDDGDGDGFSFQTVQGKYYYTLYNTTPGSWKVDLAAGLGFGTVRTYGNKFDPMMVGNIGANVYLPKNNRFYFSTKANHYQNITGIGWGKTSFSLQFGFGVRLR